MDHEQIFQDQIKRNMKVYVNDILIKSYWSTDLVADIDEICNTLWTYGLKLNTNKCLFGDKSDCFLGYVVTERVIEANLSKV